MKITEGKMIKFVCDACKKDIEKGQERILTLRKGTDSSMVWDICPDCPDELRKLLGDGRTYKPEIKRK